ncbi:ComF family protein [Croceicoccus sp. F390]|uniref:ComF family protein n=1 Tax=Croceicoccus esteveae TaxID=3075597 RepID=A0ABU2ZJ51_9SPHN|nr:ComF family protein [Croceicoccus sp. F390]MDT0576624.1 ComF family protein [Croceicoccus sp. F390]
MSLQALLSPLVDFAYPPRCPACGGAVAGVEAFSGGVGVGDVLCMDCWTLLELPGNPSCTSCQRPFASDRTDDEPTCASCRRNAPAYAGVAAATIYGPVSKDLVLALKYNGRIGLAQPLGRMMAARLPTDLQDPLIVPVPLHRWRLWKRGYNQAALLAISIGKARHWRVCVDALQRNRHTSPLGHMSAGERHRALAGAIAVPARRQAQVSQRTILLVDDVVTSGATTDACVHALLSNGAAKVVIACFARALNPAEVPDHKAGRHG